MSEARGQSPLSGGPGATPPEASPGAQAGGDSPYPDHTANYRSQVRHGVMRRGRELRDGALDGKEWKSLDRLAAAVCTCGFRWIPGEDASGHEMRATIFCGRPGCGCAAILRDKEGRTTVGPVLRRRVARAWPKVSWAEYLGNVVVTTPPEIRERFRSKTGMGKLDQVTAEVAKVLQPEAPGCLVCCHEFGDQSPVFAPHGNAVIPLPPGTRYKVPRERLKEAKRKAAELLDVPVRRVNVYYQFRPPEKRRHLLRYMLRDVFEPVGDRVSDEDFVLLFHGLKGRRRVRGFGELSDRKWGAFEASAVVWEGRKKFAGEEDPADEIARGACPCCGDEVHWGRPETVPEDLSGWVELGGGYYVDKATYEVMRERGPP